MRQTVEDVLQLIVGAITATQRFLVNELLEYVQGNAVCGIKPVVATDGAILYGPFLGAPFEASTARE